jgi:hypothetical protein
MEFLPPAPKKFPVAPEAYRLEAGVMLWRIYFRAGQRATAWNAFRHLGPANSRFNHHTFPKRIQDRGIIYATTGRDAICTALAETFQDTRLIDRYRDEPWIVGFSLAKDLILLNTGGSWPVRAGGNMAINSGSRKNARDWSRAIYRSYPNIRGIFYPSSLTNQPCVALYERAAKNLPVMPAFNESLASPKLFAGLTQLASRLNYALT